MLDQLHIDDVTPEAEAGVEVVQQPGGNVAALNGVLLNNLTVQEAAKSSHSFIGNRLPWIAPLVEAAAIGERGQCARFLNAWGDGQTNSDDERYALYAGYVRAQLMAHAPWLMSLFDCAGALILVTPQMFSYTVPQHLGVSFDCPELVAMLPLDPSSPEDGESVH